MEAMASGGTRSTYEPAARWVQSSGYAQTGSVAPATVGRASSLTSDDINAAVAIGMREALDGARLELGNMNTVSGYVAARLRTAMGRV